MSLTGNLEDLPLLDIIQIVSFSKKTGYLAIRVEGREAAIVFRDGLVVCAYTWDSSLLDPRAAGLGKDARETLIKKRIEVALEQLIRLREGEFHFSLSEQVPDSIGTRDLRPEILVDGINPQELLLDLARGMDEDRRDSSAVLEASFAAPDDDAPVGEADPRSFADVLPPERRFSRASAEVSAADELTDPFAAQPPAMRDLLELPSPVQNPSAPRPAEPPPEPPPSRLKRILLVDDEADVRELLALRFGEGGYEVHQADGPEEALKVAARLVKAGSGAFMVVTDLGMPASGGASFQGGFEVVKRLWKMNLRPAVLMMTESLNTALKARARQMGITQFVFKPGLSKLDPQQFEADLEAFAARLLRDVLPALEMPQEAQPSAAAQPQAVPKSRSSAPVPPQTSGPAHELRAMQQRLDELRQRGDAAQISVLVMDVAREFFERAVLFLVKGEELRGLGGFGPAPRGESLNLAAREVVLALNEPSVFLEVVQGLKSWTGELPSGHGSGQFFAKLGRFQSRQTALLPLVTHRQTTAVLYGDNPETGRELPALEPLELFLDQAGMALENVFLQRKLTAFEG